ncbi:MAG: hypothetical protein HY361_04810 [Candidatus Aenigmarchaeota archaeon]|nr:hypothetical protein [Candidatus Aenigmarchaeota archaeon]
MIKNTIILLIGILLASCTLQDANPQTPQNYSSEITTQLNTTNETEIQNETIILPPPEPVLLPVKDKLAIYIIDTSKKGSTIITLNNHSIIINAQGQADGLRILKIIQNIGIRKIDYLIATNGEENNIAGIPPILLRIPPKNFIHSGIPSSAPSYSIYNSLFKNITLISHDAILGFEESFVNLIVPYDDGIALTDDNSIVVKINYGNTQALITTDCAVDCESRIDNIKANLLISNGGCDSLSYLFLQKVLPELIVFSGKPCEETQERVTSLNIPFLMTERDGDITITSDGIKYEYKSLKQ